MAENASLAMSGIGGVWQFTCDGEAQSNSAIHVSCAVVTNRVSQRSDGETEVSETWRIQALAASSQHPSHCRNR